MSNPAAHGKKPKSLSSPPERALFRRRSINSMPTRHPYVERKSLQMFGGVSSESMEQQQLSDEHYGEGAEKGSQRTGNLFKMKILDEESLKDIRDDIEEQKGRHIVDQTRRQEEVQSYLHLYQNFNRLIRFNRKHCKSKIKKGIPLQVQWMLWLRVTRAETLQKAQRNLYAELLGKDTAENDIIQIKKDIPRTFPEHEDFNKISTYMEWQRKREKEMRGTDTEDEFEQVNQQKLYQVLKAFALHMPDIGYVQGMAYIAGFLLTHLSEEDTFWMMVSLFQSYDMKEVYDVGFPKLKEYTYVFERIVADKIPKLYRLFQNNDIDMAFIAHKWFLTLYCMNFPFRILSRIWDIFLLQGWRIIFKVGIVLLKMQRRQLLSLDESYLLPVLGNLHQCLDGVDPDRFMRDVNKVDIKKKAIARYTADYFRLH